jgi:hypothetical protein
MLVPHQRTNTILMTHECKLKATNPTELEETEGKLYFDQMDDGMAKVKRSLHGRGGFPGWLGWVNARSLQAFIGKPHLVETQS